VYVTTPKQVDPIPYPTKISDVSSLPLSTTENYILEYTTGRVTLPYFKYLLQSNEFNVIIFYVCNFESFFFDFREFRFFNFLFFEIENFENRNERIKKYLKLEAKMRGHPLAKNKNLGVQISFYPRVFDSIKTSLRNPKKYLLKEGNIPSKIYCELLKGPKNYAELESAVKGKIDPHIKSMIYASILGVKNGTFHVRNA
jgi:hypothetical protein